VAEPNIDPGAVGGRPGADARALPPAQRAAVPALPGAGAAFAEAPFDALLPADARPRCLLRLTPTGEGMNAILAGLAMLAREGRIDLDVEVRRADPPLDRGPWHLRDKASVLAELQVDGAGSAVLDIHDSWEIDAGALARHDLYFKRSFRPDLVLLAGGDRIRTLGLLSDVRSDGLDQYELQRAVAAFDTMPARIRVMLHWLGSSVAARFDAGNRPNWSRMHAPPRPGQPPRVLLMGRLWNPDHVPQDEPDKREEWRRINQMRADCIRALRKAFGAQFYGGLLPDDFARRFAPDAILDSGQQAAPLEFIRRVREHPVCVTSVGLHGSNGFRLAEFVALSRAIVTEPLCYRVPGDFAAGANYLEYTTPEECVAQVARLFDHPDERRALMERNWAYYREWLRPDRLALRLVALTWAARNRAAGSGDTRPR
jgi:hypothetical protein